MLIWHAILKFISYPVPSHWRSENSSRWRNKLGSCIYFIKLFFFINSFCDLNQLLDQITKNLAIVVLPWSVACNFDIFLVHAIRWRLLADGPNGPKSSMIESLSHSNHHRIWYCFSFHMAMINKHQCLIQTISSNNREASNSVVSSL